MPAVVGLPRLLDQVRDAIKREHYSYRTEQALAYWMMRFIGFSGRRHPRETESRRPRRSYCIS